MRSSPRYQTCNRPSPGCAPLDKHRSIERFHRTLLEEWAYVRPYACEAARTAALARWLHRYNHHRMHTAIGGPPVSRVTNLPREHI